MMVSVEDVKQVLSMLSLSCNNLDIMQYQKHCDNNNNNDASIAIFIQWQQLCYKLRPSCKATIIACFQCDRYVLLLDSRICSG